MDRDKPCFCYLIYKPKHDICKQSNFYIKEEMVKKSSPCFII